MNDINSKITLKASDMEDIICPGCQNKYFKNVLRLKKVSALYSPSGQETIMPIPVIACEKCGKIVKDLEE
jgi:uncharacterized Zn finger protein